MAVTLTPAARAVPATTGASVPATVVLARMRLALLRHALRDPDRAFWIWFAGIVGLLLAAGTVVACAVSPDLGATLLGVWMLGWVVGPLVTGGDEPLRAEHFTSTGLSRWRLGWALLVSSLVGVAPAVTAVAVLGVVAAGVRGGALPALLAVVAAAAQLGVLVATSRLAVSVAGLLLRYRVGAVLAGAVTGLALALPAQGWALVAAFVARDADAGLSAVTRAVPSGWGVLAAEAAGRGEWALAVAAVLALVALAAVAFAVWCVLVARRTTRRGASIRPQRLLAARDAVGAATRAHVRAVTRDLVQINRYSFAVAYGLVFCALPLAVGWAGMLPWAGVIFVVMAAMVWSNQYGRDGTALWLTLVTPGALRVDLCARQRVFLLMTAPVAVVLTVGLALAARTPASTWPYLAATLPAVLGSALGLTSAVSVLAAVPGVDPHRRTGDGLSTGADARETGTTYLTMAVVAALGAPALLATRLVGWWGVVVGVATGVVSWYLLTRAARRRLDAHGVELLELLRHGRRAPDAGARPAGVSTSVPMTGRQQVVVLGTAVVGTIMLFPQGIVAAILLRGEPATRSWFLALHVPPAWSWPVAVGTIVVGLVLYGVSTWQYRRIAAAARGA